MDKLTSIQILQNSIEREMSLCDTINANFVFNKENDNYYQSVLRN